jgi:hemerythrin-like domain-containing protein
MLEMSYQSKDPALQAAIERQLNLCDLLEAIADSLPDRIDRQQCLSVARMIGPLTKQAHAAEEQFLFPELASHHGDAEAVIEKLRLEHIEDECFAEEVQFELLQIGRGQPLMQPEATGYMLRGFFEGVRRHIRHEKELLSLVVPPRIN